ncbi:hypothetical protein K438DRAFT_1769514 [Mycena galopus ATCC 62051]|nr:hypothetical protein K438DRAFT_1769514 [Mycena galopus ATCC 62051]
MLWDMEEAWVSGSGGGVVGPGGLDAADEGAEAELLNRVIGDKRRELVREGEEGRRGAIHCERKPGQVKGVLRGGWRNARLDVSSRGVDRDEHGWQEAAAFTAVMSVLEDGEWDAAMDRVAVARSRVGFPCTDGHGAPPPDFAEACGGNDN